MTNGRGRFNFHACWLNKNNNEPGAMIGMTVEHLRALGFEAVAWPTKFAMSPGAKTSRLIDCAGASNELIGEHLNIKLTTVKDHISKIFDKLGIYRREELLPKLLAMRKQASSGENGFSFRQ